VGYAPLTHPTEETHMNGSTLINVLKIVTLIVLAAWRSTIAVADEPLKDSPLDSLKREYQKTIDTLDARRDATKDEAVRRKAVDTYYKEVKSLARRALELAERRDDPSAIDAAIWVAHNLQGGWRAGTAEETGKAYDLLTERWLGDERIAPVCYYADNVSIHLAAADRFLHSLLERSPSRVLRGTACLILARQNAAKAEVVRRLRDPIMARPFENWTERTGFSLAGLKTLDPEPLDRASEKYFKRVLAEFADVKMPPPRHEVSLGERAHGELFALRNLAIGKTVPALKGEDIEGHTLSLTDHRGKVVVLVFWATWCGPCMGMVPDERALMKKQAGKPFVLLGVNGDEDRKHTKEVMAKEGMTWPSFWEGSSTGPIVRAWGVKALPTIYVIDAQGVIRYNGLRGETLDEAVEKLIKEAESKGA
jgi:thiol-disulfide isomerase/thioredoxin